MVNATGISFTNGSGSFTPPATAVINDYTSETVKTVTNNQLSGYSSHNTWLHSANIGEMTLSGNVIQYAPFSSDSQLVVGGSGIAVNTSITSNVALTVANQVNSATGDLLDFYNGATPVLEGRVNISGYTAFNNYQAASTGSYNWTNGANTAATLDTGLSRAAAGVVSVDTSTAGNSLGGLLAGAITPTGVLVSALPSASTNPGMIRVVTDSTTVSAEGQTCVGSSTNKALAFSNGSVWKCF
jgi:hypothetical protein